MQVATNQPLLRVCLSELLVDPGAFSCDSVVLVGSGFMVVLLVYVALETQGGLGRMQVFFLVVLCMVLHCVLICIPLSFFNINEGSYAKS